MIDSILNHLEQTTYTQESFERPIQPVLLCILDINMPILDGLQAAKQLKERYEDFNKKIVEANNLVIPKEGSSLFVRPMIVHLTQFDDSFQQLIKEEEKADIYLQKPIAQKELVALLRLIKLV